MVIYPKTPCLPLVAIISLSSTLRLKRTECRVSLLYGWPVFWDLWNKQQTSISSLDQQSTSVVHKRKWSHGCRLTFSLFFLCTVGLSSTVSICIHTLSHLFIFAWYTFQFNTYLNRICVCTNRSLRFIWAPTTCRVLHKIGLYIRSITLHNLQHISLWLYTFWRMCSLCTYCIRILRVYIYCIYSAYYIWPHCSFLNWWPSQRRVG